MVPTLRSGFSSIALVLGVLALRDLKTKPRCTGKGRAWLAIVGGGIGTAVSRLILVARLFSPR